MECSALYAEPADLVIKSQGDHQLWPGVALVEVACDILDMYVALGGRSVGVAPLLTFTTETTVLRVSDPSALKHVLRMFEAAGQVGRLLAWMKCNFVRARATNLVSKGQIHADLQQALQMLKDCLAKAAALDAGEAPPGGPLAFIVPWTFPVGKFAHWVSSAQVAHRQLCADVMAAVVKDLQDCAAGLLKVVPTYDIFFSPTLKLDGAAKLLLQWPSKKALGAGCCALEAAMIAASSSFTTWGMEGSLNTDPRFAEQMAQVEAIYTQAKSALMTIAGVFCAVKAPKDQRRAQRDTIVKQKVFLPKTLLQYLLKMQ